MSIQGSQQLTSSVYSMTGYGSASVNFSGIEITVVVRAVNSRFLDMVFKLPDNYLVFENKLRECVQSFLRRGRIEIIVKRVLQGSAVPEPQSNNQWIANMFQVYQKQAESFNCCDDDFKKRALLQLLRTKEAFGNDAVVDSSEELKEVLEVLKSAIQNLIKMRTAEGIRIKADLQDYVLKLGSIQRHILDEQPSLNQQLQVKLQERLKLLLADTGLDSTRLQIEAAFLADRADVSEELSRIASHLDQFKQTLASTVEGKKIEFITQELAREFNTLGVKVSNSAIQCKVIEAKTYLEKIREQCANVE